MFLPEYYCSDFYCRNYYTAGALLVNCNGLVKIIPLQYNKLVNKVKLKRRCGFMEKDPLEIFKEKNPELFGSLTAGRKLAYAEGVLPVKYKFLIAMSLDAASGAANGVKSLALQAMKAGATKEEVLEAIHVTYFISGASSVYTAAQGLNDIL
jgi:alkylhydroperoxidase/carboxymuconolactone decarboxylase family protein YurZ